MDKIHGANIDYNDPLKIRPSRLKNLTRLPTEIDSNGKYVRYFVAASLGEVDTERSKLKEMTDPYDKNTRLEFTNAAYSDPTLSPALETRNNAFFEQGIELIFELRSILDENGKPMDEKSKQSELEKHTETYGQHLQQIKDWTLKKDINIIEKMKASHIGTIVQGKSVTMITPPLTSLDSATKLPIALTTMATEEIGNPIIDTKLRKLVGVKLDTPSKKFATNDEMIYCVRKNWNLRKDTQFHGASAMESVLQASKAYKRLINFDFVKAVVAGYLTKLLIRVATTGENESKEDQLREILNKLVDEGTDLVGISQEAEITPVKTAVDTSVLELATRKLEEILISAGGSTMAQLGRTANLNRDTATIMEIAHQKYVRTPDETLIASFYEEQILNPLFLILAGIEIDEETGDPINPPPVKIKIIRKEELEKNDKSKTMEEQMNPEQDETTDDTRITDDRLNEKKDELEDNKFKQKDVEDKSIGS